MRKSLIVAALPLSLAAANLLNINSEKVIFGNGRAVAIGNVFAEYGEYFLKAQKVVGNESNGVIVATGKVVLWNKSQTIFVKADKLIYNTRTGVIELFNARGRVKKAFFKSGYLVIRGKIYLFKGFCGSECADFQAEVCSRKFIYNDAEGRGTLKDATIKVEGHTIFYTPWYSFLTRRKTGFLPPSVGADYFGNFFYRQAFFWAIDRTSDATFTGDYRADKLYGLSVEFRKFFSRTVYLETLNAYYVDNAKGKYWWVGRDYYRKNRFLLSGKGFANGLKFAWDFPSDKDFYYDVYFFEDTLHYKSFAESYFEYWKENRFYSWNFKVAYFYNLESVDRSKDRLVAPDFTFYWKQRPIARGIYYDFLATFNTDYTENQSTVRFQLAPSLKFSWRWGSTPFSVFLKPYYRRYIYSSDSGNYYGNVFGVKLKATSLIYSLDLISTEDWNFSSIWDWVYEYQPFVHRDVPNFDYFDQNYRQNIFTLRSLNYLQWRGHQIAQVIFEQPYNFYSGYNFPTDGTFVKGHKLPFKLYYTFSTPNGFASWNGKIYYDYGLKKVILNSQGLSLNLVKTPVSSFSVGVGFTKSINHSGETLTDQYNYGFKARYKYWHLNARAYYDNILSKQVRSTVNVAYVKKCWSLSLNYQREFNRDLNKYNWSVFITFTVFGRGLNFFLGGGSQ